MDLVLSLLQSLWPFPCIPSSTMSQTIPHTVYIELYQGLSLQMFGTWLQSLAYIIHRHQMKNAQSKMNFRSEGLSIRGWIQILLFSINGNCTLHDLKVRTGGDKLGCGHCLMYVHRLFSQWHGSSSTWHGIKSEHVQVNVHVKFLHCTPALQPMKFSQHPCY